MNSLKTTPGSDEADYVIVGGGSAGCALAGRLSEAADCRVALLEAGGDNNNWIVNTPAAVFLMVGSTINNWHFSTTPQRGLNGRKGYQPRGKGLGGSSAINAMVYTRGNSADFDHWADLGNSGWSYSDVLPYFRRAEDNQDIHDQFHGQGGPLGVSYPPTDSPIHQLFFQAVREAGFPLCADFNGQSQEGLGLYQATMRGGERCSAARAYLQPVQASRPNLRVETHAHATRILFEGRRAVGVAYRQHGVDRTIRAAREVVLSAGVFQTPQLLMLSGVGDAGALKSFGIDPLCHHGAVGQNLHDHPDFVFGYASDAPYMLGFSFAEAARMIPSAAEYHQTHRGPLASNIAECGGFLKSHPDLDAPDLQLHFGSALVDDHGRKFLWGGGFTCHVALLQPKSRGSVGLQSADPLDAPAIDPNFLDHPGDLEAMVAGFKLTRRLMDTPALQSVRTRDMFTKQIHTDDDIRQILRDRADTVYHPVGSCAMGPDKEQAVVDPQLRVHGLGALRIVDASIMPRVVSANTNATSIMIGEKAADLIRGSASPVTLVESSVGGS